MRGRAEWVERAQMVRDGKRQQILLAAEKLLANRRFHEVTLGEVARVAAVGKGTIYQYFEDKEDLFFQVTSGAFDELCGLLARKVRGDAPFEERLLDVCVQVAAFFRRHRPLFARIQAEEARMACSKGRLRERWIEKRVKLVQVVTDILRKGVAEGKVRSDIEPETLAEFLLGMIRTSNLRLQSVPESMHKFEMVTDLFCNGAAFRLPIADCRLPNGE
jgi:AcrR family transcriptional regulator